MALKDLFGRKFTLVCCPTCGRVKRHNHWVLLTTNESQKLSKDHRAFTLVEVTCPTCEVKEAIGLA